MPFHTDAVQAAGQLPIDFAATAATALTLSAHKFGGPPSVGALLLRRGVAPVPVLHGGGQEREVRSGTLDVPGNRGARGGGRAVVTAELPRRQRQLAEVRDELVTRVRWRSPSRFSTATPCSRRTHRLPANAHFSFPGCEGDDLLMLLDAQGIECSTGSACSAGVAQPSHVLLASAQTSTWRDPRCGSRWGTRSTKADVDALVDAFRAAVERARGLARGRSR